MQLLIMGASLSLISCRFTTAIMAADVNKDGKLSKEEFMSWANGGSAGALADQHMLTKWMDLFAGSLAR